MISEFNKSLDDLENLLEESWTLPLASNKYIVNGNNLRSIIESLRSSLPQELKKAKEVLDAKDKTAARAKEEADIIVERAKKNSELMLSKAKKASEQILENARAEAEQLINEQQITTIANERAEKLVEQARQDAIKMRNVTISYIDGVINESEKSLGDALSTLNQLKQSYSGSKSEQ
jgi:cell division septum initiation protein DivIVA